MAQPDKQLGRPGNGLFCVLTHRYIISLKCQLNDTISLHRFLDFFKFSRDQPMSKRVNTNKIVVSRQFSAPLAADSFTWINSLAAMY
jgi:hypothetical protein